MEIFTGRGPLASYLHDKKAVGSKIGFVPTMGALHEGHISLVDMCRKQCDLTVVSIFVNPTQFNDPDDLRKYPRTEKADMAMLASHAADVVFIPSVKDIYPEPDKRVFDFGRIDKVMEGATRPGHFNGVAQVVSRLFDAVNPDAAYFGRKDLQQIAIIKALVAQEGRSVQIVECPIVRDADGLALSSRNALLDCNERRAAPLIYASLRKAVALRPAMTPAGVKKRVTGWIDANEYLETIYFDIVDPLTLESIASWDDTPRPQGCVAVQAGGVRLIDNIEF